MLWGEADPHGPSLQEPGVAGRLSGEGPSKDTDAESGGAGQHLAHSRCLIRRGSPWHRPLPTGWGDGGLGVRV